LAVAIALPQQTQRAESLVVEVEARVVVLRASDLAALPRDSVRGAVHDEPAHTYTGYHLRDLLRRAGVATDSLGGPALARRVVVEAADGYRVIFSLPELDTSLANGTALLAASRDGRPLPAGTGPWYLVVPTDGRPARWVRGVTRLRVRGE